MWHPPESVRHPVPVARWPAAEEAARSRWFSPLRVGRVDLRERTWVPAMVPWRATDDGIVTDQILAWYERFALGRPGAIVVEATGVRDIPSGPLLRIGDDRFIPGLRELVRTVTRASEGSTRLFIQIIDFLAVKRRPEREKYLRRFLEITGAHRSIVGVASDEAAREALVAMTDEELASVLTSRELEALRVGYRERVTDVHLPHIRCLPSVMPRVFADAAVRAEAAGFDGVELHYAHAYTMASFLSALNTRDDGYGGNRGSRIRLPLEVFRAVRAAVSDRFVVGCRYLAEETIEGGSTLDDAVCFGVEFARAGLDYLSLSRGGKFEDAKPPQVGWAVYPYTGPSGWECMPTTLADERGPFGRNVAASGRIRAAVRAAGFETPVIVSGGIHDFDQAERILARGDADICGAARQSLADPDWFRKVRSGRGQDVRRCTFTNYCEGLDQKHKQVTCKLWDRVDVGDPDVMRSLDGKRRLTAPLFDFDCEPCMAHESEAR
jgi:2,4-dienoyl-CoA reductase-like NADH-dependent reductase (Old Yellow Enzyme family)